MNIVLGSAFRNAAGGQIDRWVKQCVDLKYNLISHKCNLTLIAVEGDSTDKTRQQLRVECARNFFALDLITCNHGKRVFGSTEEADRLEALSQVGNAILSGVNESDDILIYVESDLIWDAKTITALIDTLMVRELDVVAPLIFAGDNFYDIFLYRGLDGERFSPFFPYHSSLFDLFSSLDHLIDKHKLHNDQELMKFRPKCSGSIKPVEVSSAGSCLVMKAEVARRCRIRNNQALLGFCKDVRESGYHIFVDPTQRIYHP